jgi:hypothetical protein
MIDRNSIHPVSLYRRMADNMEDHDCQDCNGTGFVDIDTGGGNTRTEFCKCAKGQELAEADDRARESKVYDS